MNWEKQDLLRHICQMTEFGKIAKNRLANWPTGNYVLELKKQKRNVKGVGM